MTVPQLAVLAAATACFASHLWGLVRFFRQPGGGEGDILLTKAATAFCVLAHFAAILFFYRHGAWRFAAALALYAFSLALFWWCIGVNRGRPLSLAFSADPPRHLVAAGPYALVRHPFYASYLLCWAAGALAAGEPLLIATVLGMGWLYHRAALAEEAKFAASPLAGEYARYAARTKRYVPFLF
jgi:protein-S-isoprenylcysteine O-methyltransferase Ste14